MLNRRIEKEVKRNLTKETINHNNNNNYDSTFCVTSMINERSHSSSLYTNNTDAILLKQQNYPVSQLQKSSSSSSSSSSSKASILAQQSIIASIIPSYSSLTKFRQTSGSKLSLVKPIFTTRTNLTRGSRQQQKRLVNYKTNTIIDNRCFKNKRISSFGTYKMVGNSIYYLSALLLFTTLCALSSIPTQFVLADNQLLSSLQKLKINSDIIDVNSYTGVIKVEVHGNPVKPGDSVPAKNFKDLNLAKITWDSDDYNARHTLLLLDLDRKPGPNSTQNIYNQYTNLNVPGNVLSVGQTIVAFEPPIVPCQPSTKHRILMLVFHQDQNIDISDVAYLSASSGQTSKRENFKLGEFISRHRLSLVAANVFLAIGDTNGVCSGSLSALHSSVSLPILIAMVIAATGFGYLTKNRFHL